MSPAASSRRADVAAPFARPRTRLLSRTGLAEARCRRSSSKSSSSRTSSSSWTSSSGVGKESGLLNTAEAWESDGCGYDEHGIADLMDDILNKLDGLGGRYQESGLSV